MAEEKKETTITPSQYFDYIKNAKQHITTEKLKNLEPVYEQLAQKYVKTRQVESANRLAFLIDVQLQEEKLIDLGIDTFIYKDVIEDYITNVASKAVKIIELSRYMREIPDELVDVVEKTRDIFNEFYVVFTDYTGKEERKVEKERRDKDPILFGVFKNDTNVADRFYFLGDWVDEYCDLTLDKMVAEYKEKKGKDIAMSAEIPGSLEELRDTLKQYVKTNKKGNAFIVSGTNEATISVPTSSYVIDKSVKVPKESFFDKVRSVLTKKK